MSNTSRKLINKNSKFTFILPFIFATFPIIFQFSKNLSTDINIVFQTLFIFIITAFILWLVLGRILNRIKSALIVSICIGFFFSYGHVRPSIGNFFNMSDASITIITLVIYLISIITFLIFIIKTKRALNNLVKIIIVSAIIIMMMPVVDIGKYFIYGDDHIVKTYSANMNNNSTQYDGPDVYYILPDAYAGSKSLKTYWDFDNSDFENFLTKNGFYVTHDSYSNYDYTFTSLPSTMNMEYLHNVDDPFRQNNSIWQVFDNFRSKGYTTYFIESGVYLDLSPNNVDHKSCSPSNLLDSQFIQYLFEKSMMLQHGVRLLLEEDSRNRIICQFDELDDISKNGKTPKFVLGHIFAPHEPHVFGPTGENSISIFSNINNLSAYRNNLYIDQLQFVNYKLKHIVTELLSTDNPPIIIIQSDHGKRGSTIDDEPVVRNNKQLNNFRAYYIPNGDRNIELENASPVNTFRVLFNTYFDGNYEILENKFYIANDIKTNYTDVTNSLINSSN